MNDHRYALLHARATSDAKGRHHVALTRHGLPDEVTSAAYTLRVLELHPKLVAALIDARMSIQAWHGMGMDRLTARLAWELYEGSPEIQRLDAVLGAARKMDET